MKLDKTKPYGTITGHATAMFEQDGLLFDGAGMLIQQEEVDKESPEADSVIPTAEVSSAESFLAHILKEGPLSKSVVYNTSQNNNQLWQDIQSAAAKMKVVKFQFNKMEMWKLPDSAS